MTKKDDDGKIGGVKSTKETSQVQRTENVSNVGGVKPTSTIAGIGKAGAIGGSGRRATRTMTLAEREELFKLIHEEADKMFAQSGLPKEKRDIVQNAVRMAVDSGLTEVSDDDGSNSKKRKPKT